MSSSIPSTFDSAALAQLKFDARVNPDAEAKQVSRQFEAVFINQLLQSMRKATFKSELFQSDAKKTYESLFDREIANQISRFLLEGIKTNIEYHKKILKNGAFINGDINTNFLNDFS